MGTRSLTVIQNEDGVEICVLYSQFDGYPDGMGNDLKKFLKPIRVVGMGEKGKTANGMSCLAAQIVAHFKVIPGNFYLHPAGTRDAGEEFIYTISLGKDARVRMKVQYGCVTWFGLPGTKDENMPVAFDGLVSSFNAKKVTEKIKKSNVKVPNDFLESQEA